MAPRHIAVVVNWSRGVEVGTGVARIDEACISAHQKFRPQALGHLDRPTVAAPVRAASGPCVPTAIDLFLFISNSTHHCYHVCRNPGPTFPRRVALSRSKSFEMAGKGSRTLNEAVRALSLSSQTCRSAMPAAVCETTAHDPRA